MAMESFAGVPMIRAIALRPALAMIQQLPRELRELDALLSEHGISRQLTADSYARIPLKTYVGLLEQFAVLVQDDMFGLKVGQSFRLEDTGPTGLVFLLPLKLGDVLRRFTRYGRILQNATRFGLEIDGDFACCPYQILDPAIKQRRQDAELSLAACLSHIRAFLGASWSPVEVHFEHPAPQSVKLFSRIFRAPVLFDQPDNRLILARTDLERFGTIEHASLLPFIERHLGELMNEERTFADLAAEVEALVARRLSDGSVQLKDIARELGYSGRTLQRRLIEEGRSFRDIVSHQRQVAAEKLMESSDISMIAVAQRLGYADSAVLSRAFKAWTGHSPRQYRRAIVSTKA